ncbi:MAG: membrane protein insertase YidC [Deferrisomatales bacterium]|nr:membrane protein insertase YidC [Deferrisomatales bacterium]
MEMKRTILAVVLSMAVLLLFQRYMPQPPRSAPEGTPAQVQAPSTVPAPQPAWQAGAPSANPAAPSVSPPRAEAQVVKTTLDNDLLAVDLSSRAGAVVGARLAKYRQAAGKDAPPVQLLGSAAGMDLAGATRLVNTAPNWGLVYAVEEQSDSRVVYVADAGNGITVRKTFTLEPNRYDLGLEVQIENTGYTTLHDRLGTVMVQDFSGQEDQYTFFGPAYFAGEDYEEVSLKDAKEGAQASGDLSWVAFLEKYFLVALVPEQGAGSEVRAVNHLGIDKVVELEMAGPVFDVAPGAVQSFRYRMYLGPKEASVLTPLGSNLDRLLDYGFFNIIAQPLMLFLKWIYGFIGNYGIAIIILTTLIKIMFWPLSAKSYKSMQRMKELQPKMARLKERHGDDKERLNMEVMQLYKTHKVNPLGGCLPMLVQIPFFFALYKILLGSIELRHAPFMLWVTDLSAKDPYYITPLLMGASMFLQQKMTPTTGGNETQMKMMMYGMPIIFTFMFLNFPSGLVIYWLVNNLLSVAQQGMMLRQANANKPVPA